MASNGVIWGSTNNKYIEAKIEWSASTNTNENYSTVSATLYYKKSSSSGASTRGTLSCRLSINQNLVETSKHVTISANNQWQAVLSHSVKVYHNDDGTKQVPIWAGGGISGTSFSSTTCAGDPWLDQIVRGTGLDTFKCSTNYIDGTFTITFTPRNENVYNKVRFSKYEWDGIKWMEIGKKTKSEGSSGYSFTLTQNEIDVIMNHQPANTDVVKVGLSIDSYRDSSYKEYIYTSRELVLALKIPAKYKPSMTSLTAELVNGFESKYIQGKSKAKLSINGATATGGATISKYTIVGNNLNFSSATASTATTSILTSSGEMSYTATVTDSRGRTVSKTIKLNVSAYTNPYLTLKVYRTNGQSRDDASGTKIYVMPSFGVSSIGSNKITSQSIKIDNVVKSTSFQSGSANIFGDYSLNETHTIIGTVKDSIGTSTTVTVTLQVASVPFAIGKQKNNISIGTYPGNANTFTIAYDIILRIAGKDVKLIDYIHPIGSVFQTNQNGVNPSTYYPGTTWTNVTSSGNTIYSWVRTK